MQQAFYNSNYPPSVSRVLSRLFTLILSVCLLTTIAKGQNIPDANFAAAIRAQCPTCIDAQNNLTASAKNLPYLYVSGRNISDLSGIEGFEGLIDLKCYYNNLSILPPLPNNLRLLDCHYNNLSCLPALPPSVSSVTIDYGGVNATQMWIDCVPNNGNPRLKVYDDSHSLVNAPLCSDAIYPPTVFSKPIVTNVSCNGTNTGKIVFPATGTPGTTYTISPNIGTQSPIGTFSNLPAGAYVIKASNSNGCTGYTFNVTVTQPINPTKNYRLVNRRSGLILDVPIYTGAGNGVTVFQNTLTPSLNQTWQFTDVGNNYFRITFNRTNLGLRTGSIENSPVFQDTYVAGGTSDWRVVCLGGGYYRLQHRSSGKYLSVSNNSTTARANAVIQTLNTTNLSQQWQIVEIASSATQALAQAARLNFDAAAEPNRARLSWVSSQSTETDYFTVQKQDNQTGDFKDLEKINNPFADKNTHLFTAYDPQPTEGENTYRIELTLTNGGKKFTETKTLIYKDLEAARLYPNPATEEVFIDLNPYEGRKVSLSISDISGKTLLQDEIEKASAAPHRLDLGGLQTGLYFVRIQAQGSRVLTKKLQIGK